MSVINTSSFAKALWPGINAWYGKEYDEYPVEWTELVERHTSRRAFEEDVGISSFGLLQVKPEGAPIAMDSERQAFVSRYVPTVFALGFVITREMMDDDLYDVVGQRKAQSLAYSMRQTKEVNVANMYNRAFNSAFVGGDGVEMIATNHPLFAGGTASNEMATAADLSEASLEQASIDVQAFTNDRGLLIACRPQKLIITPSQEFEAKRILGSALRVGTTNNDLNALKTLGIIPEVVVNHYLTDSDAWFIRTNVKHSLKLFERSPDRFDMDNDWDTENAKFKATCRYSIGWSDWRGIYGTPGA
jgi:hypothetical protein